MARWQGKQGINNKSDYPKHGTWAHGCCYGAPVHRPTAVMPRCANPRHGGVHLSPSTPSSLNLPHSHSQIWRLWGQVQAWMAQTVAVVWVRTSIAQVGMVASVDGEYGGKEGADDRGCRCGC